MLQALRQVDEVMLRHTCIVIIALHGCIILIITSSLVQVWIIHAGIAVLQAAC